MKAFATTEQGIEKYSAQEIKNIIREDASLLDRALLFEISEYRELCRLCYKTQTLNRVALLIFEADIDKNLEKTEELLREKIKQSSKILSDVLKNRKSVQIVCERFGEHDFNSTEIEQAVGNSLAEEHGINPVYKGAEITMYALINGKKCLFGLDFAGRDLSKRQYRAFNHPDSVKAPLAAAMLIASGIKNSETTADIFSRSGTIAIEAAHMLSGKSVNYYQKEFSFAGFSFLADEWQGFFESEDRMQDVEGKIFSIDSSMQSVNSAKKNAKIAGVEGLISFSRANIEDIDLKFSRESVDKILSVLPSSSKRIDYSKISRIHNEFFRQAGLALKKTGKVCVLIGKDELPENIGGFSIKTKELWHSGQREYYFFMFETLHSTSPLKT